MKFGWFTKVCLATIAIKSVQTVISLGPSAALASCPQWLFPAVGVWVVSSLITEPWGLNLRNWGYRYYGNHSTPAELNQELITNIGKSKKNDLRTRYDRTFNSNEVEDTLTIIKLMPHEKRDEILRQKDENGKTPLDTLVAENHTEALEYLRDQFYRPESLSSADISQGLQQVPREVVAEHRLPSQFSAHCTTKKARTWLYDIFRENKKGAQTATSPDANKDAATSKPVKAKSESKSPLEERKEKQEAVATKVKAAMAKRAKAKAAKTGKS